MTREEIIKLAREAGFEQLGPDIEDWVCFTEEIERFAALVAAAEREACAKVAETPVGEYEVIVACGTDPVPHRIPRYLEWNGIAAAIRARGNT